MFGDGSRLVRVLRVVSGAGSVVGLMALAFGAGVVVGGILAAHFEQEMPAWQAAPGHRPAGAAAPAAPTAPEGQEAQHG